MSEAGSHEAASDYDVDEEYDNDYAENYFDNGEADDMDDLGAGGGAGEDGGGTVILTCFRLIGGLSMTLSNRRWWGL